MLSETTLKSLRARCADVNDAVALLGRIARELLPGYKLKWPHVEWMANEQFNRYLRAFDEESGFNAERRWMIYQLARLTDQIAGDTAECGVYQGAGSYLICLANSGAGLAKTHHLFDSFAGLSKPRDIDGRHWKQYDLACGLDVVRKNLTGFRSIAYHPGWIPERFFEVSDRSFSYVHIDVDLYEPTRDSMRFFYERMTPGGVILCDDYGFSTCPGATKALDEFLRDKPEKIISLSGGGGFLVKGASTSPNLFTQTSMQASQAA
jgi:O-methyltransferase